jgi:acyl-CoA synthetase (AMP-forming)/AMP-acid ligase II
LPERLSKIMSMTTHVTNIAARFAEVAVRHPDKDAVISGEAVVSFRVLHALTDHYAHALAGLGVRRGMRVALMVTVGVDLFAITFALFKIGAVPVFVDPGMGIPNLKTCLDEAQPEAFIGVPKAHLARMIFKWAPTAKLSVTVGRKLFWGGHELLKAPSLDTPFPTADTTADEVAAILFTSGSTGVPKGALHTHGSFEMQTTLIRDLFHQGPEDRFLHTFPLFTLFSVALGTTVIIPKMDFTRPGKVHPPMILGPIQKLGATWMFGSPALLDRVSRYGALHNEKLKTLKGVISVGAPVPPAVIERFSQMLNPDAQIHTPYGATEALPLTTIASHEILGETAARWAEGAGTCVGRPVPGVELRIIRISDEPIATWSDELVLPMGSAGEIAVKGPVVSTAYHNRPESNAIAKIQDPTDGGTWHRMGDLGYQDADGRVWFLGRKTHRVGTESGDLFTISNEAIFNQHPKVFRTALVGVGPRGKQKPVLCVELNPGEKATPALEQELRHLGTTFLYARQIQTFLFHPGFPVDIRHNSKIFREKLAAWAEEQLA